MPLQAIHDTVEEIPEQFRELYTEKNGKFELTGIVGIKTQADVDRLSTALTSERNAHKETQGKLSVWGDLVHDDVVKSLDRIPELEAASQGKLDDAAIEDIVNKRVDGTIQSRLAPVERENKRLAEENAALLEENNGFKAANTKRAIHDNVREALVSSKVINEAHEDALFQAERIFEVREDDGEIVTKDGVGVTPGVKADIWLTEMQPKRPHWWAGSQGSGAQGGKGGGGQGVANNPFSREHWNLTKQGEIMRTQGREKAEQLAKMAGTTVGGGMPAAKK